MLESSKDERWLVLAWMSDLGVGWLVGVRALFVLARNFEQDSYFSC